MQHWLLADNLRRYVTASVQHVSVCDIVASMMLPVLGS